MTFSLKTHRSNGIRVSPGVKRRIGAGNQARDARDWAEAARNYRAALDGDPALAHIWIQLGHAHKELGESEQAEDAYLEAQLLQPGSAEPLLHLGHIYKDRGAIADASRSYLLAVRADPRHPDALGELMGLFGKGTMLPKDILVTLAADALAPPEEASPSQAELVRQARAAAEELLAMLRDGGAGDGEGSRLLDELDRVEERLGRMESSADATPAVAFDISDLISYFRNARLPTGIQRVQIEAISSALKAPGRRRIMVCVFAEHRDEWVEIPPATFLKLCRLSLADGARDDTTWIAEQARLQLIANAAPALQFPRGAYLINLGTSWWLQNYFLFIRHAKREFGIRYVPFVHDFIPVMASEHCVKELTQDFISWAIGAFDHADHFLVNSEATKRDLMRVADYLGHDVDEDDVVVVRLDADFRKDGMPTLPTSSLARWGIEPGNFVLFVSTIESRKNHLGAFDAWINLIRRHGLKRVPQLVCVGNAGWLNDSVYARLQTNDELRSRVLMLSGLSDSELDLLYRSCLFTLYPSRYEGWGLPVTESLCYGKVPLCSDASSLPEAGGSFAAYFESGSTERLTEALARLIYEPGARAGHEHAIAQRFRPRDWREIADDMAGAVTNWQAAERAHGEQRTAAYPRAVLGAYHPITRNFETRIWPGMRSGEIFRAGAGWWGPDSWGCWTKRQGGELAMALPTDAGPLRLYLQVHGLPGRTCPYDIDSPDAPIAASGVLPIEVYKWLSFNIDDVPEDGLLRIRVRGHGADDLALVTDGGDQRVASIGVCGFFLCRRDDAVTRADFLEAVALGNLDDIAFNRRPAGDDGQGLFSDR